MSVKFVSIFAVILTSVVALSSCTTGGDMSAVEEILSENREKDASGTDQQPPGDAGATPDQTPAPDTSVPRPDLAELQEEAFQVLKEAQEPYSPRQNRLTCAYMVTNPEEAKKLHPSDSPLTWEEFVDPLLASCWEWIGEMSEQEMEALVLYEQEFAADIFKICDTYRQLGRGIIQDATEEWLELNGEPASLAKLIAQRIVRECKKR